MKLRDLLFYFSAVAAVAMVFCTSLLVIGLRAGTAGWGPGVMTSKAGILLVPLGFAAFLAVGTLSLHALVKKLVDGSSPLKDAFTCFTLNVILGLAVDIVAAIVLMALNVAVLPKCSGDACMGFFLLFIAGTLLAWIIVLPLTNVILSVLFIHSFYKAPWKRSFLIGLANNAVMLVFLIALSLVLPALTGVYTLQSSSTDKMGECEAKVSDHRDYCYYQLSLEVKDPQICERIGIPEKLDRLADNYRDSCFSAIAKETKNLTLCNKILSYEKDACYSVVGSYQKNETVCDMIEEFHKDYCYENVAVGLKDRRICRKILDHVARNECNAAIG